MAKREELDANDPTDETPFAPLLLESHLKKVHHSQFERDDLPDLVPARERTLPTRTNPLGRQRTA